MEKLKARQFVQLSQYYASCNRRVMPVLPVNTVPSIVILLAQYRWNSKVGMLLTVGTLLVYDRLSNDYYYWKNTVKRSLPTLGIVLHQYWEDSTVSVLGDSTTTVMVFWYLVLTDSTHPVLVKHYHPVRTLVLRPYWLPVPRLYPAVRKQYCAHC